MYILIFCCLIAIQLDAQEIKFHNSSQQNIELIADTSNKPYFIYLYETGNFDCHKMENYTFKDEQLIDVVNQNLISNKIDANSDEGYYLKQSYSIELLPALLFFNESEELLLQQEVAMGSVSFLKLLAMLYKIEFDEQKSSKAQQQFDNAKKLEVSIATQYATVEPEVSKKPILLEKKESIAISSSTTPKIEEAKKVVSKPEIKTSNLMVKAPTTTTKSLPKEITKSVAVKKEFVEIPTTKNISNSNSSMMIQLGAFNRYSDVVDHMMSLKPKTNVGLSIIEEDGNGRMMYKLVSANTFSNTEANDLAKRLKAEGIDCFVRKSK